MIIGIFPIRESLTQTRQIPWNSATPTKNFVTALLNGKCNMDLGIRFSTVSSLSQPISVTVGPKGVLPFFVSNPLMIHVRKDMSEGNGHEHINPQFLHPFRSYSPNGIYDRSLWVRHQPDFLLFCWFRSV